MANFFKIDTFLNIFVADSGNKRVQMFCQNSQISIKIAGTDTTNNGSTDLNAQKSIAFDSSMNMYIDHEENIRVQKFLKI